MLRNLEVLVTVKWAILTNLSFVEILLFKHLNSCKRCGLKHFLDNIRCNGRRQTIKDTSGICYIISFDSRTYELKKIYKKYFFSVSTYRMKSHFIVSILFCCLFEKILSFHNFIITKKAKISLTYHFYLGKILTNLIPFYSTLRFGQKWIETFNLS